MQRRSDQRNRARFATHRRSAAFTLIETLVTVAVIAILIAILIPALQGARMAARETASRSNLRQNAAVFHAYAASRQDRFPVVEPDATPRARRAPGPNRLRFPDGRWVVFPHFAQVTVWPVVLMWEGHEPSDAWRSPSADPEEVTPDGELSTQSSYAFSASFMAGPEHWRRGGAQSPEMWRAMRQHESMFPALKALLFENLSVVMRRRARGASSIDTPVPIAFQDGHVSARSLADATEPVPNTHYGGLAFPLLSTEDGVLGRDY